jgi:dephospho-CoA kinase
VPVLGITGGIATGKSSLVRELRRCFPAEYFDADAAAKELLESDPKVRAEIVRTFGDQIYPTTGGPDRALLREIVFAEPAKRELLEGILHPEIRRRWTARAGVLAGEKTWLCVDIPLLFESRVEHLFHRVAVVACSSQTQRHRLEQARGLESELIEKILAAQLDLQTKMRKAHHLIWNDSTPLCLAGQASLLASILGHTT